MMQGPPVDARHQYQGQIKEQHARFREKPLDHGEIPYGVAGLEVVQQPDNSRRKGEHGGGNKNTFRCPR